jgi:hypothetical protein
VTGLGRLLTALAAAALIAAATGCGSDSSGNGTSTPQVSIPSPTSPLGTTSTAATTTAGKKKGAQTTTANGGTPATCSVPGAFQRLTYTGLDCTSAVGVATAWDQNGKQCNTVDNPNVDAGYQRTCSVEGFSCTAKRDIHSDARLVTCTQGAKTVRFTWLPA